MSSDQETSTVRQFLTPQESAELLRVRQDSSVIGFTLISFDGIEIESSGAFREMSGAIFANIFDIADQIGEEFGSVDTCPMLFMESADLEVAGITMSSSRAVIIKRKQKRTVEGLRSVG